LVAEAVGLAGGDEQAAVADERHVGRVENGLVLDGQRQDSVAGSRTRHVHGGSLAMVRGPILAPCQQLRPLHQQRFEKQRTVEVGLAQHLVALLQQPVLRASRRGCEAFSARYSITLAMSAGPRPRASAVSWKRSMRCAQSQNQSNSSGSGTAFQASANWLGLCWRLI